MKHAWFMTVVDGVFCLGCAHYKLTWDAFRLTCLTGVRFWAVINTEVWKV